MLSIHRILVLLGVSVGVLTPVVGSPQVLRPGNEVSGEHPVWVEIAENGDAVERALYEATGGQALWVNTGGPGAALVALGALYSAGDHGLDPERYDYSGLRKRTRRLRRETLELLHDLAGLERDLTRNIIRLAQDLRPAERDPKIIRDAILRGAREGRLAEALQGLAPAHAQYARLQNALRHEEGRLAQTNPIVGKGPTLVLGSEGPRVEALRLILVGQHGVESDVADPARFDLNLEYRVREYQRRHGLTPDGQVGPATQRHLDGPREERVAQIRINLERWRQMPGELGDRYVQVNIPSYRLSLVQGAEEELSMRVVVGKRRNPTPVFADEIEYLVLNPYWYVPRRIVWNELLPKLENDPTYLARNGYELLSHGQVVDPEALDLTSLRAQGFPYRVRQRPGAKNSLGQLKFMLPNEQSIYLHDTPADHLFSKSTRAYSHGCVRVEHPVLLAEALLGADRDWGSQDVASILTGGKRHQVNLRTPVPVYITYFSVVVDETGVASFYRDIYGQDPVSREQYRYARVSPSAWGRGPALVAASP